MNANVVNPNHEWLLRRFPDNQGEIGIVIKALRQTGLSYVEERHICETFSGENLSIFRSVRGDSGEGQAIAYLRTLAPAPKKKGFFARLLRL